MEETIDGGLWSTGTQKLIGSEKDFGGGTDGGGEDGGADGVGLGENAAEGFNESRLGIKNAEGLTDMLEDLVMR